MPMLARSLMCYLLCGTRLFQQAMRNTLTNVIVLIAAESPIDVGTKGTMLAMIPLGYLITQIPGGALADRLGAKNVMTATLSLSALCCIFMPAMYDTFGMTGMLVTLVFMGLVQGPLFPTSSVFLSKWMPQPEPGKPDEKAWGTAMLDIGISMGTLFIIPAVTFISEAFGWRRTYQIVGLVSFAFIAVWQVLAASTPAESWIISKEELEYLEKNMASKKAEARAKEAGRRVSVLASNTNGDVAELTNSFIGLPWGVALHSGLWAVFFAHMAFNFGAYYLTNWSPTYYKDVLGVGPKEAYLHLMIPHLTNLAAKTSNPSINAWLARNGYDLLASRKAFTCAGFMLASAVLTVVYPVRGSVWASTICFSLANAFFGLAPSGFKSNYLDITEEYVGLISGYGNTLGTVSSFLQPKLLAFILDSTGATKESTATGSWTLVLLVVAGTNVAAAAFYSLFATTVPIEQQVRERQRKKAE